MHPLAGNEVIVSKCFGYTLKTSKDKVIDTLSTFCRIMGGMSWDLYSLISLEYNT